MIVIYAEKSSLAKTIAGVLHAEQRIPLNDESTIGYYQFRFNGEDAGVGLRQLSTMILNSKQENHFQKFCILTEITGKSNLISLNDRKES